MKSHRYLLWNTCFSRTRSMLVNNFPDMPLNIINRLLTPSGVLYSNSRVEFKQLRPIYTSIANMEPAVFMDLIGMNENIIFKLAQLQYKKFRKNKGNKIIICHKQNYKALDNLFNQKAFITTSGNYIKIRW